jgi:putative endonuclease
LKKINFSNIKIGASAEVLASDFLKRSGYKLIRHNYRNKLGEIDIIAKDKDTFCFIEVKSRYSDRFGIPQEAVSALKQRKISKVALSFIKENNLFNQRARFDVVAVYYTQDKPKIELIKDAFELNQDFIY